MKKIIFFILIFLSLNNTFLESKEKKIEDESSLYYPIHLHNIWYYKGFKKSEPEKVLKIKAEIIKMEKIDNKEYAYFYAPKVDIRYLIRKDKNGVYMRLIRYPFPIFNFSIDVDIIPEMKIISFPLKVGKKWEYEGKARTKLFGFWEIKRKIKSKFEIVRKEKVKTEAGEIDTYHIKVLVDEGDGKGYKIEQYWYGKNTGYTISDTSNHKAELVGYKLYTDDGKIIEKIPEGVEKYE